jgi:hypothetical protein
LTATRSRALAALAACRQTRGAIAGEGDAVVDDARAVVAERRVWPPEPLWTEAPPQAATIRQLSANAAHQRSLVR